jgi:hypothetical protein
MVIQVVAHLFNNAPRDLRSTGSVEISDWVTVVYPLERRELLSDFVY